MPNWNDILTEIQGAASRAPLDVVRRHHLAELAAYTGRATIAYYSGWLSAPPGTPSVMIGDEDKNAFMTAVHGGKFDNGLDLILHTPGGDIAAAESLVDYLRQVFGTNIRAIVPQLAMSAGTMIACSAKEIVMGKQSSLGPIDPQFNGIPAVGVLAEFEQAAREIQQNPAKLPLWGMIISKYHPTFLGTCRQSIDWAKDFVRNGLSTAMLADAPNRDDLIEQILAGLLDQDTTRSHARHLNMARCKGLGLEITAMEDDNHFQDLVLTVHHAYMHTLELAGVAKIVENERGIAVIRRISSD